MTPIEKRDRRAAKLKAKHAAIKAAGRSSASHAAFIMRHERVTVSPDSAWYVNRATDGKRNVQRVEVLARGGSATIAEVFVEGHATKERLKQRDDRANRIVECVNACDDCAIVKPEGLAGLLDLVQQLADANTGSSGEPWRAALRAVRGE